MMNWMDVGADGYILFVHVEHVKWIVGTRASEEIYSSIFQSMLMLEVW
jgi:hypothetical protein